MMTSQKKLIEKIHNEFDTAEDRLLKQAESILSGGNLELVTLSERLTKLGFVNTSIALKGSEAKNNIVKSKEQADLIQYYKCTYPFLKFITEEELNRICKKYRLINNPVENYIGNVPIKNIDEIERAQTLKSEDKPSDFMYCKLKKDNSFFLASGNNTSWCGIWGSTWYRIPKRIDNMHFRSRYHADEYLRKLLKVSTTYMVSEIVNYTEGKQGLFICAPPSQFRGKNKQISFVEVKDPIVFRYVRGGVQIISKWGLEASDPLLINPIEN